MSFPYFTSEERRSGILANYEKLQVGISGDDVLNIMGNPDQYRVRAFVDAASLGLELDLRFLQEI